MERSPKHVRFNIRIPQELYDSIVDFQHDYRLKNMSEAGRKLLEEGIKAARKLPRPERRTR